MLLINCCLKFNYKRITKNFTLFHARFSSSSKPKKIYEIAADTSIEINNKTYVTDEWTNITPVLLSLIKRHLYLTPGNPLNLITESTKQYFNDFKSFEYRCPVVDLFTNFDTLLIPENHVSRSKSDTYYVNSNYVLRSHTSAHQAECFKKSDSFLCIADVYRRDEIDSKHFPAFHQCEVAKIYSLDHNDMRSNQVSQLFESEPTERTDYKQEYHTLEAVKINETIMKSKIEDFIRILLDKNIKMRWIPAYFPFTHPSWELEIFYNDDWIEILGSGIVEHQLLVNSGINDKVGWALGFGLERLAMIKYEIPDIRLFWSKDSGFLSQFENAKPNDKIIYKPISNFPQCINDISFWLPNNVWSRNDFYDLVRSYGGDLVEQVKLIDEWKNKKGKVSNCYRIVYRSHERVLTQNEVNLIHKEIEKAAVEKFGVEIR